MADLTVSLDVTFRSSAFRAICSDHARDFLCRESLERLGRSLTEWRECDAPSDRFTVFEGC
jgi:hypothetical protein